MYYVELFAYLVLYSSIAEKKATRRGGEARPLLVMAGPGTQPQSCACRGPEAEVPLRQYGYQAAAPATVCSLDAVYACLSVYI